MPSTLTVQGTTGWGTTRSRRRPDAGGGTLAVWTLIVLVCLIVWAAGVLGVIALV